MKILLAFVVIILSLPAIAQQKNQYNTQIDSAGTVNIYGNGTTIIGKIIVAAQSKLYLSSISHKQVAIDTVETLIKFETDGFYPIYSPEIILRFDKRIYSMDWGGEGSGYMTSAGIHTDSLGGIWKAQQFTGRLLNAVIRSKVPLFVSVYGVARKRN
jgi:hypothetical protein